MNEVNGGDIVLIKYKERNNQGRLLLFILFRFFGFFRFLPTLALIFLARLVKSSGY